MQNKTRTELANTASSVFFCVSKSRLFLKTLYGKLNVKKDGLLEGERRK